MGPLLDVPPYLLLTELPDSVFTGLWPHLPGTGPGVRTNMETEHDIRPKKGQLARTFLQMFSRQLYPMEMNPLFLNCRLTVVHSSLA